MSSPKSEFINTMIKAGAGAGKTYGLIHKIVDLVREFTAQPPNELPRFVVTTFTRKATQEVRERLLSKALELRKEEPEFGDLFLKFLRTSGLLMVSTIHGVLNQFLRKHGRVIGLDPDFRMIDNSETLLNQVLHDLLCSQKQMDILVSRIGWSRLRIFFLEYHRNIILNPNIQPVPADLFITHWEEQLKSIETSIYELTPFLLSLLIKSKSDSLRRFSKGLQEIDEVLRSTSDIWLRLEGVKRLYGLLPKNLGALTNWEESAKENRQIIMRALAELAEDPWTSPSTFESYQIEQSLLADLGNQFSHLWIKKKIEIGEIELEDLELLSLFILRNFPEETRAFSQTWNYWFIDEYQDTSPIQVEVLNYLIGGCPHYVVGDPQQSIYFFRGARSKVFNEKLQHFSNTGAKIEFKQINRRSQTPTLHFINDLMDLVNKHQFSAMTSTSSNHSDELTVGHFYLISEDEQQHLNGVSQAVINLLGTGVEPSSIAILCRENKELNMLFKSLDAAKVPVRIASQGRFTEDRLVKDALSLWKFLVNPFDNVNLIELLRSNWFRISDQKLLEVAQATSSFLWDKVREISAPSITQLKDAIRQLDEIGHVEVWQNLLLSAGAFGDCTTLDPSGRMEGNLWKLISHITELNRTGMLNYSDPLEIAIETDSNNELEARSIREANQVQLMTIHASKGLEFDHVFIPFLNHNRKKDGVSFWTADLDSQFWSVAHIDEETKTSKASFYGHRVSDEIDQLLAEEAERLFYVAITRAKRTLHFFPPEDEQQFSPTGWARHLRSFTDKGCGLFRNEGDHLYEFTVTRCTDIQITTFDQQNKEVKLEDIAPLEVICQSPTESISVTHLLNKKEADVIKGTGDIWNIDAIKKGIDTHRDFERYTSSRNLDNLREDLKAFIARSNIPFSDIIQRGFPEWPFRVKVNGKTIDGQIDLWGWDKENQLWIIDFKTGSPSYAEKAFSQMLIYAWALRETRHLQPSEKVILAVCYPYSADTQLRVVNSSEIEGLVF